MIDFFYLGKKHKKNEIIKGGKKFMTCTFCDYENEYKVCDECFERIIKQHILKTDEDLNKKNKSLAIINALKYIFLCLTLIFLPSLLLFIIFLIISKKKNKAIEIELQEKYENNNCTL